MTSPPTMAVAKESGGPDFAASPERFSATKHKLIFSLLLVAAVLVFYSPVTRNGFLNYDDDRYITENLHVRAGLTWQTVSWAFTTFDVANYHPLTWLSFAFDAQLFGLNATGHHEVSVLLHAFNAVLLFLLLLKATGFFFRSLFVATLFALHPLNVESVAWAAERKNVLSMLFFLLALHAYLWYAHRPQLRRYAVVALLFVMGLLSKPQVITFPLLLLLFDYWPLCRFAMRSASPNEAVTRDAEHDVATIPKFSFAWLAVEKVPLLLLSAASAGITMKAQNTGGAVQSLSLYSPLLRIETGIISYVRYLGKAFWPTNLVALYPHPTLLYPAWQVGAATLLLLLITAAVLLAHDRRYLLFGWFWFLGSLVPMLGLVQVGAQSIADRYTYIPLIGLFVSLTWLVAEWAALHRLASKWLAIPSLILLLVLGILTYRQVGYWHDSPRFWQRTIALTKNNYVAHDALGDYLLHNGRNGEAAVQFHAALDIRPDDLPANLNVGIYEHSRGNLQAAIPRYQMVARYAADVRLRSTAYGNLGSAYRQLGDLTNAKQCYESALQWAPDHTMAMIGLGLIAQKNGDPSEAVREYSRAMAIAPTDVGYLLLAQALRLEGSSAQAKAIDDRVSKLSPNLAEAQGEAQSLLAGK